MATSPNEVCSRCAISPSFLFGDRRLAELTQPAVHILKNIPSSGAQTHK